MKVEEVIASVFVIIGFAIIGGAFFIIEKGETIPQSVTLVISGIGAALSIPVFLDLKKELKRRKINE